MEQFIGTPLTLWEGEQNMRPMENFSFINSPEKKPVDTSVS